MSPLRYSYPIICLLLMANAWAQPGRNTPLIGYAYPDGGCRKSEFEVTVGGIALTDISAAVFSGPGFSAVVLKHFKPLNNDLENKIRELIQEEREKSGKPAKPGKLPMPGEVDLLKQLAGKNGISQDDIDNFLETAMQRRDPKRQPNAQLAERITLRVKIDANATTGKHDLRLLGPNGLSNPIAFMVGTLPEISETEPNNRPEQAAAAPVMLPAVINGRILPGDVDCFAFDARKNMKLTVAVAARELTPYLADAVPGWFQAVATLLGPDGREVAYTGGFSYRPDPLLCVNIPADGRYVLKVHDSIYRGREDFVYRATLGEIPCLTEQFPTGGQTGTRVPVRVSGWNLADYETTVEVGDTPGIRMMAPKPPILGFVWFQAGCFAEFEEFPTDAKSNNPWELKFPCTINAMIGKPGEHDIYAFRLKAGTAVVAEVHARRLGSPLDSMVRVTGPDKESLASNDDHDDPSSGLLTHHADSMVTFTAPKDGIYRIDVSDTQGKGSRAHTYRLTVAPPQPGFDVRIVPASLSGRAGATVPLTARVARRDGFTGEIELKLVAAPAGYELLGSMVPAGADTVQMTLKLPKDSDSEVVPLTIEGHAKIAGHEVVRKAEPAEDRMQAFFYRHLVPAEELLACVTGKPKAPVRARIVSDIMDRLRPLCTAGLTIPAGGSATLQLPGLNRIPSPRALSFALNAPPSGITMAATTSDNTTHLTFSADTSRPAPDNIGNLIVNVFVEPPADPPNSKAKQKKQPIKIGTLPPIPCRIIAATPAPAEIPQ